MESDAFQLLIDLGYDSVSDVNHLNEILSNNSGDNLTSFSRLIAWLTQQLSDVCRLDERVQEIDSIADLSTFVLEINSFLKEFESPYEQLKTINEGNFNGDIKLLLIYYLSSELEAASMISSENPVREPRKAFKNESEEAIALRNLLMALGFPKPPANITWSQIFTRVEAKLSELCSKLPQNYLGKPLLNASLTYKQWLSIQKVSDVLNDDFKSRIQMLLKRLDVTVQSFKWADRLKDKNDELNRIYNEKRNGLVTKSEIGLDDLLAARDDLCLQEKTCSTRLMTSTKLHKLLIPKVPDRGGRTSELQPPPPEMPAFMQRQQQQQQQQPQRQQQRVQSGRGGGQSYHSSDNKWNNDQQQSRPSYDYQQRNMTGNQGQMAFNHRPQSDFEKYQNQDYDEGRGAKRHYEGDQRQSSGRGGRGGRGGGGGRY